MNKANLDEHLNIIGSGMASSLPAKQVPWQWGQQQKIQTKQIKLSKANIKIPGTVSNIATATGTIGAGSTQFITDTLRFATPHGTELNVALLYVAVYEGTSQNPTRQIFPVLGGSQSWGSYSFQADYDFQDLGTNTPGTFISTYRMTIHNNMGAAGTYFFASQWKYLVFNSGTVI